MMQEIALAGLMRSGFFEVAAFYGGTALRIFYGLDRFSEDLDFSLLDVKDDFSLENYFDAIVQEFAALGILVQIREKIKSIDSKIDSAFLKSEPIWNELILEEIVPQLGVSTYPRITIKIEVDTKPPKGFSTEENLLIRPFSFYVKCFVLPDLMAGKIHALLFRNCQQCVKGRDWYDFEWYIKKGVPLHLEHFLERVKDTGHWLAPSIREADVIRMISAKINEVSMDAVRADIEKFIPDTSNLEIWSKDYFRQLLTKMKFS